VAEARRTNAFEHQTICGKVAYITSAVDVLPAAFSWLGSEYMYP
jgi:hypothetical protein